MTGATLGQLTQRHHTKGGDAKPHQIYEQTGKRHNMASVRRLWHRLVAS